MLNVVCGIAEDHTGDPIFLCNFQGVPHNGTPVCVDVDFHRIVVLSLRLHDMPGFLLPFLMHQIPFLAVCSQCTDLSQIFVDKGNFTIFILFWTASEGRSFAESGYFQQTITETSKIRGVGSKDKSACRTLRIQQADSFFDYATTCIALFFMLSMVRSRSFLTFGSNILTKL